MAESIVDKRPKFIVTRHEHKIASIGAGSRKSVTANDFNLAAEAPEGYSVAGVRQVYGGDATLAIYQITPTATGNSNVFRIMNQYGEAMTNKTAVIEILWMRNEE